jgi:hypothetical protein
MKGLFSILSVPFLGIFGMAFFLTGSVNPFPYNIYPSLIIIIYSIIMEVITRTLLFKRAIRLIIIWFFAIIVPPVWNVIGIGWLFGKNPPITSYDVALPAMWIFITIILYIYSISVALVETFQRKK